MEAIIDSKRNQLEFKIKSIRIRQTRLPKILHDYLEYENLIQDLADLSVKESERIQSKIFFGDLVVLYGGQYFKYAKLKEQKQSWFKGKDAGSVLKFEKKKGKVF